MKATFEYEGLSCEAYTNGKIYAGVMYVDVKRGYNSARGIWNVEAQSWKKRIGSDGYDEAVARALGLIVEPVVEVVAAPVEQPQQAEDHGSSSAAVVRKPRTNKALSPELAALMLPEGQTVRLVRGELKVVERRRKMMEEKIHFFNGARLSCGEIFKDLATGSAYKAVADSEYISSDNPEDEIAAGWNTKAILVEESAHEAVRREQDRKRQAEYEVSVAKVVAIQQERGPRVQTDPTEPDLDLFERLFAGR